MDSYGCGLRWGFDNCVFLLDLSSVGLDRRLNPEGGHNKGRGVELHVCVWSVGKEGEGGRERGGILSEIRVNVRK